VLQALSALERSHPQLHKLLLEGERAGLGYGKVRRNVFPPLGGAAALLGLHRQSGLHRQHTK
jgi:hypothetical protein